MSNYYDGLNEKLLAAIPSNAQRVLELGCANGRLGRRYKESNPNAEWWGVEISSAAAESAARHLDRVFCVDIEQVDLKSLGQGFDVIVIGDLLEHLREPERVLETLNDMVGDGGRLVCCIPNMAHLSVSQRLVAGDISYDDAGLLDRTHTRFFSQSSAFKALLDSGWLPHLHDSYRVEAAPTGFAGHIVQAAEALGVPRATALRNLGQYQMIIECKKWSLTGLLAPGKRAPISIIVPVNNAWQYELNLARSPGLQEIDAEVIRVDDATSAAEAFAVGSASASHAWRVLVHQDVYFPRGSGMALAQQLGSLTEQGKTGAPVGFAGLEPTKGSGSGAEVSFSGFVIDRTSRFDHGASDAAVSIDELAVAVHQDCEVSLDPGLGWHLWGTDLCLQGLTRGRRSAIARIIRVPLFHNSLNDHTLPDAFHRSADILLAKYPQWTGIPTLCGQLTRRQPMAA